MAFVVTARGRKVCPSGLRSTIPFRLQDIQPILSRIINSLLPLLCVGLLMPGLATAGLDGHLLQGRKIPECDSNCGTWCCPPALRCAYVEMAGGASNYSLNFTRPFG
ncbi:hypothetical protein FOBRF1_004620 [Fusarium oxysporum]